LNGPSDVSRFDSTVTSDTKENGKTVRAEFDFLPQCVFADDSDCDSGEGGCEDECTAENFVHGFNYVDPRLIDDMNVETSQVVDANIVDVLSKNRT
jgi:hypothetical protein